MRRMKDRITDGMESLITLLQEKQSPEGSWDFPFETGISTDCYMIILLRSLEIDDEILIRGLTDRIISRQENNGAWKLFYDEPEGNISATFEAYYALLYSGYYSKQDPRLKSARNFILSNGGIEKTHMFTKIMLAITGQYEWPPFFPIPIEFILLPTSLPINFYSFSVYGRANLLPIMLLVEKKFVIRTEKSPNLNDLFIHRQNRVDDPTFREWRTIYTYFHNMVHNLVGFSQFIYRHAIEKAKQYMVNHIEPDGTLFSYFSSTFLMIFALLSHGFSKKQIQMGFLEGGDFQI